MKYVVTIKFNITQAFVVEADNAEQAEHFAMYEDGSLYNGDIPHEEFEYDCIGCEKVEE